MVVLAWHEALHNVKPCFEESAICCFLLHAWRPKQYTFGKFNIGSVLGTAYSKHDLPFIAVHYFGHLSQYALLQF